MEGYRKAAAERYKRHLEKNKAENDGEVGPTTDAKAKPSSVPAKVQQTASPASKDSSESLSTDVLGRLQQARELLIQSAGSSSGDEAGPRQVMASAAPAGRNDAPVRRNFLPAGAPGTGISVRAKAIAAKRAEAKARRMRMSQFPLASRLFTGAKAYDLTWFRSEYEEENDSDSDDTFYAKLKLRAAKRRGEKPPNVWERLPDVELTKDVLASLCENPVCAICLEGLAQGQTIKRSGCGHIFHKVCCKPWFAEKATCPLCRQLAIVEAKGERIIDSC